MTRLAGFKSRKADDTNMEESNVKILAQQFLTCRKFKGIYLERRWVEMIKEYRDIVTISKDIYVELTNDLNTVKKRLREFYGDKKWIGITGPNTIGAPEGFCLWLKKWNEPLGEHEFYIKNVEFEENEIYVSVKSIKLTDSNPKSSCNNNNNNSNNYNNEGITSDSENFNFNEKTKAVLKDLYGLLTVNNIKTSASFIIMLLAVIFTFLISSIKWLGEFTIRFTHEVSYFIHVCMPLLLALVGVLEKTIGGFYLLLAMVWRSFFNRNNHIPFNGQLPPNRNPYVMGPPHQNYRRRNQNFQWN
ncbi:uncharacterized protein LOC142327243 [Lycorma delicatula]|uniref:uncharacterized protein LOC142327243 n=1 Tax=Lycorma delicatula TaxID=130591 RepID=UPI003F50F960